MWYDPFLLAVMGEIRPLIYISWTRVSRRIDWHFRVREILKQRRIALALTSKIGETFKPCGMHARASVYFRRGYGDGEVVQGRATIYWEAPLAISLWRVIDGEEHPVAGIGVELRRGYLCVRQLQGVEGVHFNGRLREWPRLAMQACIDFARANRLKGIRLYRARQNIFYHYPTLGTGLSAHERSRAKTEIRYRMRARYDGLARELGFSMKKHYGELLFGPCSR